MKYLSGFVTGFLCGGGAVCAALLYLHRSEVIDLHMLDKDYVRKMYQPKTPWIRNHFDYSYHGRHYNPFEDHKPEAEAKEPHESYCHECKYFTSPDDEEPCVNCRNAYFHDKGLEDLFEAKED